MYQPIYEVNQNNPRESTLRTYLLFLIFVILFVYIELFFYLQYKAIDKTCVPQHAGNSSRHT